MPLPIIADVYRVALNWTGPGSLRAANVIHLHKAASSAAAMATLLDANVTAAMWESTPNTCSVTSINVTPLDGSGASYLLATTGAKWAGNAGASDIIPAGSALVSLRTAFRGRSNRGRVYLPFVAETNQVNGLLTAGVATGQAAWNTFLAAVIAAGAELVVASYKLASSHTVQTAVYETALATQRRRQTRLR